VSASGCSPAHRPQRYETRRNMSRVRGMSGNGKPVGERANLYPSKDCLAAPRHGGTRFGRHIISALLFLFSISSSFGVDFRASAPGVRVAEAKAKIVSDDLSGYALASVLSAQRSLPMVFEDGKNWRVESDRSAGLNSRSVEYLLALQGYQTTEREGVLWILRGSGLAGGPVDVVPGQKAAAGKTGSWRPWDKESVARVTVWVMDKSEISGMSRKIVGSLKQSGLEVNSPDLAGVKVKDIPSMLSGYGAVFTGAKALGLSLALDWVNEESRGKAVARYEGVIVGNGRLRFQRGSDIRFLSGSTSTPGGGTIVQSRSVDTVTTGLKIELDRIRVDSAESDLTLHVSLSSITGFDGAGLPQTTRSESEGVVRLRSGEIVNALDFGGTGDSGRNDRVLGIFPVKASNRKADNFGIVVRWEEL